MTVSAFNIGSPTQFITVGANAIFANDAFNLGGYPANSYVRNIGDQSFSSGNVSFNGNIVFSTVTSISANGSTGLQGQILASNGSSIYWTTVSTKISQLEDVVANNLPWVDGPPQAPANGSVLTYISDFDKYFVLPINVTSVQDIPLSNTVMDGGDF